MKSKILLKNPLLIDPSLNLKNKSDLLIENGKISRISSYIKTTKDMQVFNLEKLWVIPGIIDIHVHSRVPGNEDAENFNSLSKSSISAGITSILVMPNTNPPQDNPDIIKDLIKKKSKTYLNIFFSAAITKKREGKEITNFLALKKAGVKAFTDDGSWVKDDLLMKKALKNSIKLDLPILSHCQFPCSHPGAPINEGYVSNLKF